MKKRSLFNIVFILFLTSWQAVADELVVAWEPWAPYQYQEGKQLTGLDIELITAIMTKSGHTVKFLKRPWKRQLIELQKGTVHIVMGASKTIEREKFANFSVPYRTETVSLYINAENKEKFKDYSHLNDVLGKDFTIGVVREYHYGDDYAVLIKQAAFKKQVKEVTDELKNYKKLLNKRIDSTMEDPVAATAKIRKSGWDGKFHALFNVYSDDVYLMFSKSSTSKEIITAANKSLSELKADGTYQKIIDKYIAK